jgi:hypothetical protein
MAAMVTYTAGTTYVRDRFDADKCPCCGGELNGNFMIGLNVDICGSCGKHGHCLRDGAEKQLGRAITAAIELRNDGPVADLPPGWWLPCSEAVTS